MQIVDHCRKDFISGFITPEEPENHLHSRPLYRGPSKRDPSEKKQPLSSSHEYVVKLKSSDKRSTDSPSLSFSRMHYALIIPTKNAADVIYAPERGKRKRNSTKNSTRIGFLSAISCIFMQTNYRS